MITDGYEAYCLDLAEQANSAAPGDMTKALICECLSLETISNESTISQIIA
jgi:hypothetical protein